MLKIIKIENKFVCYFCCLSKINQNPNPNPNSNPNPNPINVDNNKETNNINKTNKFVFANEPKTIIFSESNQNIFDGSKERLFLN